MKIVVAGGTGFVGRHIARALMDDGHEVAVLGRDPSKVASIAKLRGAASIRGDVTDASSLTGAFDGIELIVGVVQFPNYPVELPRKGLSFDRYDRQGTENLIAEAKRAGVTRYIYLSGAGADVTSHKRFYRAKGLAEEAVASCGLAFAIIRPSWAYGEEDRALNRFLQIARMSPVVPQIGVRTQRVQPIYVGDIATYVQRVVDSDEAWGQIFEVGGPVMTMNEVIKTMLDVAGLKRLVLPIPAPLAKLGTAPLVVLPKPFMSPSGIDFAVQDALVETSTARSVLGLEPMSLREGLRGYLAA